jgi:uncharacterized protein (DUF1697 family)
VFIRSAAELRAILQRNPFADKDPKYTHVVFLQHKPPTEALADVRGRAAEELRLGKREIYVYYPRGMGLSKLQIPVARVGTSRNLNTVAKLVALSSRN